jgi:rSAM/selenodomain-associated transferase 1
MRISLVVIAKTPAAGRSKTRLTPPLSPAAAARLAEAALTDTLHAAAAARAERRVLILDGAPGRWLPDGFEVIAQRGGGLDERLAHAFADVGGPALIIGMDTPQVDAGLLELGLSALSEPAVDAVLGPALDGGYWAIGLRRPDPSALIGVPMSTERTVHEQRSRLRSLGLTVRELPALRDVDTYADACAVAATAPETRFARELYAESAA